MDADSKNQIRLTDGPEAKREPLWSPNGGRIAYWCEKTGFHHIFVIGADGNNRKRLTHNQEHHSHPTWSPDGGEIAYVDSNDDFPLGARVHLTTADRKCLKQLSKVRDGIDYQPDISPAGLAVSPTSKTVAS